MSGWNDPYVCGDSTHDRARLSSVVSSGGKAATTPEILSKRWHIGLDTAKRTLQVTTQAGVRNVLVPSERKVRMKAPRLKFPSIKGKFYVDEMFAKVKSARGFIGASVNTNGLGYDLVYLWNRKAEHPDTLMSFIHDVSVP